MKERIKKIKKSLLARYTFHWYIVLLAFDEYEKNQTRVFWPKWADIFTIVCYLENRI